MRYLVNPVTGALKEESSIPPATAEDADKFLRGDGTWAEVDLSEFSGTDGSDDGTKGMVPPPSAGDENKTLQGSGEWGHKLEFDAVIQNGSYGYLDLQGNFVSFKSQADIDAAVAAAMVGTATAADVKSGVTFTNSSDSGLTGTFEAQTKTVTAGTSAVTATPDSGKYLSSVTVNPTPSQTKTVTGSRSAQTVTPDSGYLLSKVTVNKYPDATGTYTTTTRGTAVDMGASNNYRYVNTNGVTNTNSGTYTIGTASTGATIDMGATNTYRYVNATNVYNKGKKDAVKIGTFTMPALNSSVTINTNVTNFHFCVLQAILTYTNNNWHFCVLFRNKNNTEIPSDWSLYNPRYPSHTSYQVDFRGGDGGLICRYGAEESVSYTNNNVIVKNIWYNDSFFVGKKFQYFIC